MPPYPFSQRPTFTEFKEKLREYGCEYTVVSCRLDTVDFYTVPYFKREMPGRVLRACAIFEDDDRMEFSDIRRICRALEVPSVIFGLDLSDWHI